MSDHMESIKARIRKLLALANNGAAAEGEIENALMFAKSLMDRHHLDEGDLVVEPEDQYRQIEDAPKGQRFVSVGKKIHAWEAWLGHFVQKFVGVNHYLDQDIRPARDHRGIIMMDEGEENYLVGKRFCFYGADEDCYLAAELFHELRLTIISLARLKWGGCYRGDGAAYAEGFVDGLCTKLKQQADEQRRLAQTSGALVLIERRNDLIERKQIAARNWLAREKGIKLRRGNSRAGAYAGSDDARREGRADGKRADVDAVRRPKLA